MKTPKLIVVLATTLLLVACTKTTKPVAKEEITENKIATEISENTEIPESSEISVAECEGNSDALKQAGCYWAKAFEEGDQSICDLIPTKSEAEIKTALEATDQEYVEYYMHLTPDRCKNEFDYEYDGADWHIESGIPPYPELINVYSGRATLQGWIEYMPAYVGDPEAHFHVADADVKKLPLSLQAHQDYLLIEPDTEVRNLFRLNEDMIKELEAANENDPATIIVDRVVIISEGSPALRLVEIVQN